MKTRALIFIAIVTTLLIVACSKSNTISSDSNIAPAQNLSSTTAMEANNLDDDMQPRPEDILQEAGIELSIPAMTNVLLNTGMDSELRYWAAIALGRTGNDEVIPTLETALAFSETDLRYGAVVGLGELESEKAVSLLETALYDSDSGIRSVAVSSLAKIGGQQAVNALSSKLLDFEETDPSIRMNIALQLGRLQNTSAIPALQTVLNDGSIEVRTAGAIALANLGNDSGTEILVNSALDPLTEEWLRIDAINAIEKLSGQQFNYTKPYSAPSTVEEQKAALRSLESWWQINKTEFSNPQ